MQAEEGRASLNNESIDPAADDGSGCYDDRGSVTQSVEEVFVSQNQQSRFSAPHMNRPFPYWAVHVKTMQVHGDVPALCWTWTPPPPRQMLCHSEHACSCALCTPRCFLGANVFTVTASCARLPGQRGRCRVQLGPRCQVTAEL